MRLSGSPRMTGASYKMPLASLDIRNYLKWPPRKRENPLIWTNQESDMRVCMKGKSNNLRIHTGDRSNRFADRGYPHDLKAEMRRKTLPESSKVSALSSQEQPSVKTQSNMRGFFDKIQLDIAYFRYANTRNSTNIRQSTKPQRLLSSLQG